MGAGVTNHTAVGVGVYSYFRDEQCLLWSAIRTAVSASDVAFTNAFTQHLNGYGAIMGVINGELEPLESASPPPSPSDPSTALWAALVAETALLLVCAAGLGSLFCIPRKKLKRALALQEGGRDRARTSAAELSISSAVD